MERRLCGVRARLRLHRLAGAAGAGGARRRAARCCRRRGAAADAAPTPGEYALWLALSALGSVLLLAATSHITQNIASVPFLWVLPLTLYC